MKLLLKDFLYNLKMYFKFVAKLGFKDLFLNILLLFFLLILGAFAYIPVGLVSDLIRTFLSSFVSFNDIVGALYDWFFAVIAAVCSILLFAYLFNNRFDFKNNKVVPVEGTHHFERKEEPKPEEKEKEKDNTDLDLPKEKEE